MCSRTPIQIERVAQTAAPWKQPAANCVKGHSTPLWVKANSRAAAGTAIHGPRSRSMGRCIHPRNTNSSIKGNTTAIRYTTDAKPPGCFKIASSPPGPESGVDGSQSDWNSPVERLKLAATPTPAARSIQESRSGRNRAVARALRSARTA